MSTRIGQLVGGDDAHPASGKVVLDEIVLKLEDVNITEAPDGRVILAKDFDEASGARLGALQGFTGSHDYMIPEDVNSTEYNTVLIWCDQFNVPIGKVQL